MGPPRWPPAGDGRAAPPIREVALSSSDQAPGEARQFVARACQEWCCPDLTPAAELVISELVSNAVRHAGGDFVVVIAHRRDSVYVGVRDSSRHPPRIPPMDPRDHVTVPCGRGLRLVSAYATGWGSVRNESGKLVWATLRIANGANPAGGYPIAETGPWR